MRAKGGGGGICEVNGLNLKQEKMYRYDFNGLYTFVRLKYDYPVGEPKEIGNPPVGDLEELFGLIKAIVYNDGSMPLGIPCRIGKDFNRLKGRVLFKGRQKN